MEESSMPSKKIFKMELAVQLIRKGHDLVGTKVNKFDNGKTVFIFNETKELLRDVTEFTS